MANKTKRIKAESFATEAEFTAAVDRVAWIDPEIRRLQALRDLVLLRVKNRYNEKIEALENERDAKVARGALYATEHRSKLLPNEAKDGKSCTTRLGMWGFRLGNQRIEILKGWTWAKVLEKLKEAGAALYIRVKEETDKEAMLIDAKKHGHLVIPDDTGGADLTIALKDVGVELVQDETFFIEPKPEAKGE